MIARLRTAAGNVPLFEQAGAAPGVPTGSLTHAVRPDLLAAAERAAAAGAGALPEPSAAHLRAVLVALARDVMPWCSPARRSGRASMRRPTPEADRARGHGARPRMRARRRADRRAVRGAEQRAADSRIVRAASARDARANGGGGRAGCMGALPGGRRGRLSRLSRLSRAARAGSRRRVGAGLRCRRVRAGFDGDRRVGRDARTAAAHGAPRRARAPRAGVRRASGARAQAGGSTARDPPSRARAPAGTHIARAPGVTLVPGAANAPDARRPASAGRAIARCSRRPPAARRRSPSPPRRSTGTGSARRRPRRARSARAESPRASARSRADRSTRARPSA